MKTILIIDDQPSVLNTMTWLLESRGYRCITAVNAAEAVQRFSQEQVDVAIVDHSLPDADGFELAARLKAIRPVPVIMLTGHLDLKKESGSVDLLLTKPQNPPDLLEAIEKLTGK